MEVVYNRNLFYLKDLDARSYANAQSSSTPALMSVRIENLKPNTKYTVTTNAPLNASGSCDLFADNYPSTPSTAVNGLKPMIPKVITTDSTGIIEMTFRNASANASLYTNITEIMNGKHYVKVEECDTFTYWTPAPEDILG